MFEEGQLYPHHNLYYVTSVEWDLRALQSRLAFVADATLCVHLFDEDAQGFLRFQAQYLRRIRIPRWDDVPAALREELADAATRRLTRLQPGRVQIVRAEP